MGTDLDLVRICSTRILGLANSIVQAHDLGVEPGTHRSPWTLAYQQQAVDVYLETLPPTYLADLGVNFDACADMLEGHDPPEVVRGHWDIIASYLRSTAFAIRCHPGLESDAEVATDPRLIDRETPGVMRFDRLAELMHRDGALELAQAARAVRDHTVRVRESDLSDEELAWLQRLTAGAPVIDVATEYGYSLRSMHRALAKLWLKMGVETRSQGLALAAQRGWLAVEPPLAN